MGFKKRTIYKLVFDDPELEGMVVKVRRGSIQERLDYDLIEDWRERLVYFERFLVEWNLEDDDGGIRPYTTESLFAEEDDVIRAILNAWVSGGRVVRTPLETPSSDGVPEPDLDLESTMPMASLAS